MTTQKKNTKNSGKIPLGTYFEYYNQLLDSSIGKALNLRKLTERFVYEGTKNGIKAANAASRVFKGSSNKGERLNNSSASDLFDLSYNEDQLMIQQTIRQFAEKMRIAAEKCDDAFSINEELWNEFIELQLAYMQVPESFGGMMKEKSTTTQMMIVEELAHGDLGQAYAFYSRHSVLNAIVQWGTESQQQTLIPEFLNEHPTTAVIAVNEPVALFSPFTLNTTATRKEDKYILNGKKNMIPLGETAAYFLIAAQTDNEGIQLYFVDNQTEGISVKSEKGMGLNAAALTEIHLENVSVHASAKLGGEKGIDYTEFIQYCKLGWCALAVGCCQAILDYVIPYCNERHAFGEPISNRQAVAFMIADIKIELESMRILTQRAAAKAEQGLDFKKDVYLAHVLCCDKAMEIGSNGVQLLGGHGYIRDYPVERWYRDLRAVSINYNGIHL